MGNPASRDMRAQILGTAQRLFGAKGYTVTSIADIAAALNVTKGALYYHFRSKEAILDALVEEPAARLAVIAAQADSMPPRDVLAALIDLQAEHPAAYMAVLSGDASVLQEYSRRHDFAGKTRQVAAALAGPDAPPSRLIRARMAIAALKEGTMAALAAGEGTLAPTARDDVLNAAAAVLGRDASAR